MFFQEILEEKPDAIFGLAAAFQADVRPEKLNLLVGIYKNEQLQSELMPSVQRAREQILDVGIDYLPIDGLANFYEQLGFIVFGEQSWLESRNRIYAAQTLGGTGALYLGGVFLRQEVTKNIAVSDPTWPNHPSIFERAGLNVSNYFYYNKEKHKFDWEAMRKSLSQLPEKTAVVLQAVCHNPTGCDPSLEEWSQISNLMLEKKLIPFFDCAYQGFGDGLEEDAAAIRLFKEAGHEMLVAYSCSKNFSFYCQRVGALFIVSEQEEMKRKIGSRIKKIIRAIYSNPPAYGAFIVSHLLQEPALKNLWKKDLEMMRHRLKEMRKNLIEKLASKSKKNHFGFLSQHKGMFSFLDLDPVVTKKMIDEFAIYMIGSGRINVAGLNEKNIERLVDSLVRVCDTV